MKLHILMMLALGLVACSGAGEESAADGGEDSVETSELVIETHTWSVGPDGEVVCNHGVDADPQGTGEATRSLGQEFVAADNYGSDRTVRDNGSVPEGNRCPYNQGGSCRVPGVKSFSWRLVGFTTGDPDWTNIPYWALGDSLNYHKANTAMTWPYKASNSRVVFIQDTSVTFAESRISSRRRHSSSFGEVYASVPDEVPIEVRFNPTAINNLASRLGLSTYWEYRVLYEHVFSHELGHVSGLGHSPNSGDLMYYTSHAGNWSTNWLTNAEVQAIAVFSPGDWDDATILDLDL